MSPEFFTPWAFPYGLAGGPEAEFIKAGLAQAGIETAMLLITGTTRTCIAVVEMNPRRVTELNEPGPAIAEGEARSFLDLYASLLTGAGAVVLSGSLPPGLPADYYALLMEHAGAADVVGRADSEYLRQRVVVSRLR